MAFYVKHVIEGKIKGRVRGMGTRGRRRSRRRKEEEEDVRKKKKTYAATE
jgi:hypothetical protein